MNHEACRTAVLNDEADGAEVQEHLASCDACRRYADDVARVVRVAPTLYEAPDGLADRVVGAVVTGPRPRSLWADVRRPLITSTAIAAALLLVLGLAAVIRQSDDKSAPPLLAAATATEEAGSAEVQLEGSVSFAVEAGDGEPEFEELPPEVEGYFEARWREIEAEFERQMAEFEQRINQMLEDIDRQINEAFGRFGAGSRPPGPPPTRPSREEIERQRPQRPERLSLNLAINGRGAVSFEGGQLGVDGTVETAGGNLPGAKLGTGFRLAARDGRVGVRSGADGQWAPLPKSAESIGAAMLRPNAVPEILRSAADVRARGRVDLDGESVRHYAFKAEGEYEGEVWIGDDDRVRRLALSSTGRGHASTLAVSLRNFGVGVSVDAPPASGRADAGGEVLYPFNAPVREALTGR